MTGTIGNVEQRDHDDEKRYLKGKNGKVVETTDKNRKAFTKEQIKNVVDAAIKSGVEKLCFVSSIAACGKAAHGEMIDEESCWVDTAHRSPYSLSKYLSEQEVWKGVARGLNAVIVNPGVILGVSGTETGSSQLFSQVRKGLMFYTNGGSGYVYVQDVVKAMMLLANSQISAQRFVLVAENCSNRDVLSWMADGFGKRRSFGPGR